MRQLWQMLLEIYLPLGTLSKLGGIISIFIAHSLASTHWIRSLI
jgi:hypothetical protein